MSAIRSEKYVVRPYEGLSSAEDVLDNVMLRVGDEMFEPGSVVLDTHTLATSPIHIVLPSPEKIIAAVVGTPLAPLDCGLVIVARALTNRWSHVHFRDYVRGLNFEDSIELDREADSLVFADRNGFVLTIAIVLLHELQAEPLRPSSSGTWLARREFRVVPERADFSFSPDELTDAIRKQYGLPLNSPSYVRVDQDQLVGAEDLSSAVGVYLDSDILRLLQQSQSDALSIHIQAELAATTMSAVARGAIAAIAAELDRPATVDDLEEYPSIDRFYRQLSKRLGQDSISALLSLVQDPDALAAHLSAAFDVRKHTLAALKSTPSQGANSGGVS